MRQLDIALKNAKRTLAILKRGGMMSETDAKVIDPPVEFWALPYREKGQRKLLYSFDGPVSPRYGAYILKSAYEKLEAEKRRLNLICEQEFGRADSVGELVKQNADLLQWADRLTKFISDAQCECSVAERDSGHLVGCWRPDLDSLLIEFHQWREKRGAE